MFSTHAVASPSSNDDFAEIIDRHWRRVYNVIYRTTREWQSTITIAEETFLRAYVGPRRTLAPTLVEAWLMRIAIGLAGNWLLRPPDLALDDVPDRVGSETGQSDIATPSTRDESWRNIVLPDPPEALRRRLHAHLTSGAWEHPGAWRLPVRGAVSHAHAVPHTVTTPISDGRPDRNTFAFSALPKEGG
jgi:DNA-directed RNA polymerase specialized sigma24 family protein